MTHLGLLDLDPGSHGKPMNSWCISFETECTWPLILFGQIVYIHHNSVRCPVKINLWY